MQQLIHIVFIIKYLIFNNSPKAHVIESAVYVHAPYAFCRDTYYGKVTGPEKFNIYILAVTMLG